ncbi:hypothetical protein A2334_04400 [Candidatus Roizmanbacteria bacterium RIFOXYB2_FULL_38_10]|nr:MAG: hypothetical protein A2334_04400 [Candidatus Roizmanbacteria bacterium RIFOXYB2_FULL_38_10]OGK72678.1 MAG: hypothetical protein A2446_05030 [Candidatus Roizmanbacteria bacterium RIFOXYC2_FULL_38_9]
MVQTIRIQLSGLTCTSCEKVIAKKLQTIDGVQEVHVSVLNGLTLITASRPITKDEVTKVLQGTHYKVN